MKIKELATKLGKSEIETQQIVAALATTDPRFKSVSMLSDSIDDNLAEVILSAKDEVSKNKALPPTQQEPTKKTRSKKTAKVDNNIAESNASVHLTQDALIQVAIQNAIQEGATIANIVTATQLQAMTQQLAANKLQLAQWFVNSSQQSINQIVSQYDNSISGQLENAGILPPNEVAALMAAITVDNSITLETKALLPTVE